MRIDYCKILNENLDEYMETGHFTSDFIEAFPNLKSNILTLNDINTYSISHGIEIEIGIMDAKKNTIKNEYISIKNYLSEESPSWQQDIREFINKHRINDYIIQFSIKNSIEDFSFRFPTMDFNGKKNYRQKESNQCLKAAIMQPYFFPYLGYWQLINAVDKYVVYDDVAYIKGGWINRNNILINGKPSLVTLPLESSSSFKNINEISITANKKQIDKIIKSIKMAYAKAPYYEEVMQLIENLITNSRNIAELNYKSILDINNYLNINTEIILSSDLQKNNNLKAQEKVIHINKILGADTYINAIGGQELYDREEFRREGIELKFLKMRDIKYQQFKNNFVPNLSIIDILMFNSPEQIKEMLDDYKLL